MAWINYLCTVLVLVGIALFLVGANTYNATVGWTGFYMGIIGIVLYIGSQIYFQLKKQAKNKAPVNPPTQNP